MDKYTKVAKIGQGSFGCAYLATRKRDPNGTKYVIKEIRMDPRDEPSALREAKLLAALDHPNIIACRESFVVAPSPLPTAALHRGAARVPPQPHVLCIVTEFADGGDLRKRLERREKIAERDVLDLFVQVCLALKHLHDRKIIHRDIKPENIFLTRANVVKLGDFGVATVLSHTLACAATMTGTPYYTSPEICLGQRYNSKTDIWSLGCVLYELATGAHAFNGRSQRELFDNIVHASVAPIPAGSASSRLVDLVHDMLHKSPRERPSVNQLIKRPIVLERIQRFLSERALADELNHTVLHGHDIFRPKRPIEAASAVPLSIAKAVVAKSSNANGAGSAVRRAEAVLADRRKQLGVAAAASPPQTKKKQSLAAAGNRASGVALKKTRSIKKSSAVAARSPARSDRKRLVGAAPTAASSTSASASAATLEQRRRAAVLQKKRAIVEKAKQDALRARHVPATASPSAAKLLQPGVLSAPVADRIGAFNAQWRAQRQQLMQNLPTPTPPVTAARAVDGGDAASLLLPPPPPTQAAVRTAAEPTASPAAVAGNAEKRVSEYPRPVETAPPPLEQAFVAPAAAAPAPDAIARRRAAPTSAAVVRAAVVAKQRDAMRRDIQSRKLQLKHAAARAGAASKARASPLDDPIVLVQNLPDFGTLTSPSPSSTASTGSNLDAPFPPPAPVSLAAVTAAVDGQLDDELADNNSIDADDADVNSDKDEDDSDDDASCGTIAPMNLEFERMVLQLKSVVESPDLDNDDDDDDDDDDDGDDDESDAVAAAACSPLPPAYDTALVKPLQSQSQVPAVLQVATLEDPTFTRALRALLVNGHDDDGEPTGIAAAHEPALRWLHRYITAVTSQH